MATRIYTYRPREWCQQIWDKRYEHVDLVDDLKKRSLPEYLKFIDEVFLKANIGKNAKIVEMGCGSGALGRHLINEGFHVDFSDFSATLIKRLSQEEHLSAFVSDCRNLWAIPQNQYDVILMAGVVYESDNYFMLSRVYSEFGRVLKPKGLLVHFYNVYESPWAKIRHSPLSQKLKRCFNPLLFLRERNCLRKFLGKSEVEFHVHCWVYSKKEIVDALKSNFFSVSKIKTSNKYCPNFFEKKWPDIFAPYLGISAINEKRIQAG